MRFHEVVDHCYEGSPQGSMTLLYHDCNGGIDQLFVVVLSHWDFSALFVSVKGIPEIKV